jgi:hypothetical protein
MMVETVGTIWIASCEGWNRNETDGVLERHSAITVGERRQSAVSLIWTCSEL